MKNLSIELCLSDPVYLVEERPNPSTDYFLLPVFSANGNPVVRSCFSDLPTTSELKGAVVVLVRYLPPQWLKLVEATRSQLKGLIFFMDDDVLDFSASAGMPLRYRFKLLRYAALRTKWLKQQGAQLWVSAEYLKEKYSAWSPKLILPTPLAEPSKMRRFFYHGSASHAAEIKWLRPVVEEVLRKDESFAFEIIGGQDVYRLYRDFPQVTVIHPMKWPAYRNFLAMSGRHIGLAPQLDIPFNRARSYTKFFDITGCGAVGIYSPNSMCAAVINDGIEGLVVELQPEAWVDSIIALLQDESRRRVLLGNAEDKLKILASNAKMHEID